MDQACAHKRRHAVPGCWSFLCSTLLNMDLVILFWVGTGLLPPIVSVAEGAGMSCLPRHLLCHSLPVKSLTQLTVNKDQVTTPLSLGTNSPMATSKANSSNGVDFIVNLGRIWLNTRLTFAVVIKHPNQKERSEERGVFQISIPVTFHHCGKLQAGTSNSLVRLYPQPRAESNGRTHTRLPAYAQTQIPAA